MTGSKRMHAVHERIFYRGVCRLYKYRDGPEVAKIIIIATVCIGQKICWIKNSIRAHILYWDKIVLN